MSAEVNFFPHTLLFQVALVVNISGALKSSSSSSDFSSRGHGLTPTDNSGVLMDAIPPPFGATPAMMANHSSTYKGKTPTYTLVPPHSTS